MDVFKGVFVIALFCGLLTGGHSYFGNNGMNNGMNMYMFSPCKSGYFLRHPYTGRPFYCNGYGGYFRGCPWPRYYKCESMTGSDDGWGVCCYDMGDV